VLVQLPVLVLAVLLVDLVLVELVLVQLVASLLVGDLVVVEALGLLVELAAEGSPFPQPPHLPPLQQPLRGLLFCWLLPSFVLPAPSASLDLSKEVLCPLTP
jgi:hypothetical protein